MAVWGRTFGRVWGRVFGEIDAVPAAPSNLIASATGSTTIALIWDDNSNNEDGFRIERAAAEDGPFNEIDTVAADVELYEDTGLTPETTYYYRVIATSGELDSDFSNVANATTLGNENRYAHRYYFQQIKAGV